VGRYYEWKLDPLRKVLLPENVQAVRVITLVGAGKQFRPFPKRPSF
jgi:hypothetical protein